MEVASCAIVATFVGAWEGQRNCQLRNCSRSPRKSRGTSVLKSFPRGMRRATCCVHKSRSLP
eukprot:1917998-Pyramimonas_sp.AAC.1